MQSTFIKIKFMALVRQLENNNTKCLLEIVPDVSCIENIDKINWNEENNLVEYSVPVTYKITFKKGANKNQEKTYYSCIDFRHLTTNSNLACGDVTNVFSDNFILGTFTTDFAKKVPDSCQIDIRNRQEISIHESFSTKNIQDFCFEENDVKNIQKMQELHEKSFAPKAVETEKDNFVLNDSDKVIKPFGTESVVSKETITDVTEIRSDQDKKRKLTITSICTLNMIDIPANGTVYDKTINKCKIGFKNERKCNVDFNINKEKKISVYRPLATLGEVLRTNVTRVPYKRILPDARVAHFMMTVENEILPLRIMLSEIYRKCTSLGLFWKSSVFQTSHKQFLNKNKCYTQSKPKCNRVVYSIVFEE